MQIFLSWSGERSKKIAEVLKPWLEKVIQALDTFFSADDIEKGEFWLSKLTTAVQESGFGIICITKENQTEAWIHFEAGALALRYNRANVSPIIFDKDMEGLKNPLGLLQATRFDKEQMFRLIRDINNKIKSPLKPDILSSAFEKHWDELKTAIDKIPTAPSPLTPKESNEEMLREILENTQVLMRMGANKPQVQSGMIRVFGPPGVTGPSGPISLVHVSDIVGARDSIVGVQGVQGFQAPDKATEDELRRAALGQVINEMPFKPDPPPASPPKNRKTH
jgi:hypothetical protein